MESVLPGGVGGLGGAGLNIPKFGAPEADAPTAPSQPSGGVGLPPIGF